MRKQSWDKGVGGKGEFKVQRQLEVKQRKKFD